MITTDKLQEIQKHYSEIIRLLGEDVNREGLIKTPERVAKAMATLTRGYDMNPEAIINSAKFKEDYNQMVIVKDIQFYSLCEHHMLPFYGKAHVAYIPNGYITGLSKIARVVDVFSHRLQVQERMTTQIKECIQNALNPLRGDGRYRSKTHVHANARRGETEFNNNHQRHLWSFQSKQDARRISFPYFKRPEF